MTNTDTNNLNRLPRNVGQRQETHRTRTPDTVQGSGPGHISNKPRQAETTEFGMGQEHFQSNWDGRKGEVNLSQIEGHCEFGREHFLEPQCVEKDGQTNGPCIEQQHCMHEMPVLVFDQIQVDHKVHKEAKEILGPQVKELDHTGGEFVESLILLGSTLVGLTSIGKPSDWVPRPNGNVRPKHIDRFNDATRNIRPQISAGCFVVIHRAKD